MLNTNRLSITHLTPNLQGIIFLVAGMFIFSLQNIAIKSIADSYAVLEIVIIRSIIAIPCTLLFYRYEGGKGLPKTAQLPLECLRGFLLFVSYNAYFMGLAALPLADAAAIRFSSPLFLTFFSVIMLGELVGPRRWIALLIGFTGVLFIVQPGSANFNIGTLFILAATILYTLSAIITRRLKTTDSSATISYYGTLVYLVAAIILGPLVMSIGEIPNAHPSLAFLLRTWAMPTPIDLSIMIALGFIWATGMYCVARAYSLALASVAAPFEYTTLPINVMWGYLLWQEIPTWNTWLGAFLTIATGIYILYREQVKKDDRMQG